jgi:UDP-N-acetylmuramoyl-tripeptide--D-alanyl-D-alanine ligase
MVSFEPSDSSLWDHSVWMTPAAVARAVGGRVVVSGPRARRVVTDSRALEPGDLFVAIVGDRFDGHDFIPHVLARGAAGVVVDRVPVSARIEGKAFVVRVKDTGKALADLAREHRRRHGAKVVGITGSCGKTSTKDMLGCVLATAGATVASPKSFNNQIGVPLSLLAIAGDTEFAAIEIGTNAPGEIANLTAIAEPDIAILTCVREAHLAGLGDLRGVEREKATIFDGLRTGGLAILNGDDPACVRIASKLPGRKVLARVGSEADWFATDLGFSGLGTSFRLNGEIPVVLPRLGSHNVHNALFSIAAAVELGLDVPRVVAALGALPHSSRRLEPREVGGLRILDDSYNMNPASARAALLALASLPRTARHVVVFGEMRELGESSERLHYELGREVVASRADLLLTVGSSAAPIARGARDAGMADDAVIAVEDHGQALDCLLDFCQPGDTVLLKASRAAALDRLVDDLSSRFSAAGTGPGAD